MQNHRGKGDLKSVKTKNALNAAMLSLLEKRSFEKITVRNLCEKALISRAAFYAHFIDKYDFLKIWLASLMPPAATTPKNYDRLVELVNQTIQKYEKPLRNLIRDAGTETMGILFDLVRSTLSFDTTRKKDDSKHRVFSIFYTGGMTYYLLEKLKDNPLAEVAPMNEHLYEIIKYFQIF